MMHGHEKSDPEIVAMKPTNNAAAAAAELVERRAGTKGNAGRQSTLRAQDRAGVTQALERKPRGTTRRNGSPRFSITSTPKRCVWRLTPSKRTRPPEWMG